MYRNDRNGGFNCLCNRSCPPQCTFTNKNEDWDPNRSTSTAFWWTCFSLNPSASPKIKNGEIQIDFFFLQNAASTFSFLDVYLLHCVFHYLKKLVFIIIVFITSNEKLSAKFMCKFCLLLNNIKFISIVDLNPIATTVHTAQNTEKIKSISTKPLSHVNASIHLWTCTVFSSLSFHCYHS